MDWVCVGESVRKSEPIVEQSMEGWSVTPRSQDALFGSGCLVQVDD